MTRGLAETNAHQRDQQAVGRFIERFAAAMTDGGIPRMPARVFAALLVTDSGRLTSAELADILQVSPAAISGAVRYLNQVRLVSRGREPGSRRDYYAVHDDAWYEATVNRDTLLAQWAIRAREGTEVLGPDTPAGRRMADTHAFFEFLRVESPALLEKWRAYRAEHLVGRDE